MHRYALIMLVSLMYILAVSAAAHTLVVEMVHPGCVVEFEGGFRVHLTGIAVADKDSKIGLAAYDFVKRQIEGKRVAVFTWTTDDTAAGIVYDEDGVAFAKIVYGKDLSIDIATELLALGFARVNPEHLPQGDGHYRELERQARAEKVGLWASER